MDLDIKFGDSFVKMWVLKLRGWGKNSQSFRKKARVCCCGRLVAVRGPPAMVIHIQKSRLIIGVKKLFSVIPARVLGNISLKFAGGAQLYLENTTKNPANFDLNFQ